MAYKIAVKVLRGDDGNVNGISFVAGAETYSEDFIERFPQALLKGEATIDIEGDKIVLEGPAFNGKRRFEFKPKPEELEGLKASVFANGKKPVLEPADFYSLSGPGFKLTMKD